MSDPADAKLYTWLTEPLPIEVANCSERLRRAQDVQAMALMPDVHLARDVCVGTVLATAQLVYPAAVGGDIGCGTIALAFEAEAAAIDGEHAAASVLSKLYASVPTNKHRRTQTLPETLKPCELSDRRLGKLAERDGRVQLGTLGRGNHFLEFQADAEGRLWVMIHSGSRAVGQGITEFHVRSAPAVGMGLKALDAGDDAGRAYLHDHEWARTYAAENRLAMLRNVVELVERLFDADPDWNSLIHSDHNHVCEEDHGGRRLLVHRKGAQSAREGEAGVVPGSMGAPSFHTIGRGCPESLTSCSHGAGRALSRSQARARVSAKEFLRQAGGVRYDRRLADRLREEAPSAYKDIRAVMRAQRELTRIERELRPVLTYKGA